MKKSELRQIIREEIQRLSESKEYGFDLTDIDANSWQTILKKYNVNTKAKKTNSGWVWSGPDVEIFTGNNPITGQYYNGKRQPEKGYASYIGIAGKEEVVSGIASLIHKKAQSIKDYNPNEREYI